MKLTLPMPPSANRYWRTDRRGFNYLSDEAKRYKVVAGNLARREGFDAYPLSKFVKLSMDVYFVRKPSATSGDLGNRLKVVEDVLQGIAYENDCQIVEIHLRRYKDSKNPRVEISLEEAQGDGEN